MKTVRIAELKAHLSENLRHVRRGETVTVLDRDTPIAQIVPMPAERAGLRIRARDPDAAALCDLSLPEPVELPRDPVDELIEDRRRERM